jgi:hypothetical protein
VTLLGGYLGGRMAEPFHNEVDAAVARAAEKEV